MVLVCVSAMPAKRGMRMRGVYEVDGFDGRRVRIPVDLYLALLLRDDAGTAMARALSGTRPSLPAFWGFRGPVEAELRQVGEENPTIFATPVWLVLRAWFGDDARRIIRD
jgi:hypothetical protein